MGALYLNKYEQDFAKRLLDKGVLKVYLLRSLIIDNGARCLYAANPFYGKHPSFILKPKVNGKKYFTIKIIFTL